MLNYQQELKTNKVKYKEGSKIMLDIELKWIDLNWIELNGVDLSDIELNCFWFDVEFKVTCIDIE